MSRNRLMKTPLLGIAGALLIVAAFAVSTFVARTIAAPQAVIVELRSDPVIVAKTRAEARGQNFDALSYRQQLVAEQTQFLNQLSAAGIQFNTVGVDAPNGPNGEVSNIQFRYNYVFNGLTVAVPVSAIKTIEGMSQVKSVHKDEQITMQLDNAVKYVRAPSLYGNPPQVKMGDSLNTGGVHGEGIYIAIIDTGIDWTHPMFGGDPTPPRFGVGPSVAAVNTNAKVPYYLNLTAGAVQDDFGHGTHVSGIAAGYLALAPGPDGLPLTADDLAIHGVAPQAKLMGYKVLSSAGVGVSSSIIMGIEDAVQPFTIAGYPKPVAQVINLSLGNTVNDPDYPTSIACDNATLGGTTVVAAAGNSGAPTPTNLTGEGTIGSPGAGRRVLTIGATLDPGSAPNKLDEIGGGNRAGMKAFPLDGGAAITNDITANYVYCGFAETPDQVPDSVSGKIALIQRGGTVNTPAASPVSAGTGLFSNKAAFAVAKGAIAVVVYNNVDGELTAATVRKSTVPVVGISKANGEYLNAAIGSTAQGSVSINKISLRKLLLFDPDMAGFSSKGPVGGFGQVKPDVTAPGVNILSATVRVGGAETNTATMFDPTGYISASGTSMATPMTAGVVALVKQKNPGWTPSMIRAALMNTGTNLRRADGSPIADDAMTLNQQGAGLVDAYAAANAKAMMGVGAINQSLGSASNSRPNNLCPTYGLVSPSPLCSGTSPGNPDFLASWSFGAVPIAGVIGNSMKTQTVMISDVTNGGGTGVYQLGSSAVRNLPTGVSVSFTDAGGNSITQVEVPANGSASFNVNITVNGETVPANPTQIEWYITANRTDGGQTLRMPFQLRAIAPAVAMFAPMLNNAGNTEIAGNPATDINGNYQLTFAATGANAPAKLRLEESNNNGASWALLADVAGTQTAYEIANRGNGTFQYRVRGLYAVEGGLMPGPTSEVKTVSVDRRTEADVTSLIQAKIVDGSLSLVGGVWQFDQTLKNTATGTSVFAPLKFVITSVSGSVRVKNADNGADGVSSPATFDYTSQVGADQQLSPGESTAARRLQFNNATGEMFSFTVMVSGYFPDAAGAASGGGAAGGSSAGGTSGTSSSGSSTSSGLSLPATRVMQITVNPLTKSVTAKLL